MTVEFGVFRQCCVPDTRTAKNIKTMKDLALINLNDRVSSEYAIPLCTKATQKSMLEIDGFTSNTPTGFEGLSAEHVDEIKSPGCEQPDKICTSSGFYTHVRGFGSPLIYLDKEAEPKCLYGLMSDRSPKVYQFASIPFFHDWILANYER